MVTSGAMRRAKLRSNCHHQRTNVQFFYRPDDLPVAQPAVSKYTIRLSLHAANVCTEPNVGQRMPVILLRHLAQERYKWA